MARSEQMNIRAEKQLKDRCEKLGKRFGISGNEFVHEVLDLWAEALADCLAVVQEARREVAHRQDDALIEEAREMARRLRDRRK